MKKKWVAGIGVFILILSLFGSVVMANNVQSELAKVRNATAKYHDIRKAEENGYVLGTDLIPNMGYHYINFELIDEVVDPLVPEILVYVPSGNGLKLVAVEYMSTVDNSLFGRSFDPPHGDIPYTLHAWIWHPNPDGMFEPFNPNVANVD